MHVLAFDGTHAALAAQRLLEGLKPYLIPTPREVTASCGMSLRFEHLDDVEAARALLEAHPELMAQSHWHEL